MLRFFEHRYPYLAISKLLLVLASPHLNGLCMLYLCNGQALMLVLNAGEGAIWWSYLRYMYYWSSLHQFFYLCCILWYLCNWQAWMLNRSHRCWMLKAVNYFLNKCPLIAIPELLLTYLHQIVWMMHFVILMQSLMQDLSHRFRMVEDDVLWAS